MASTTLFARLQELFALDPLIDEIGLVLGVDACNLTAENAFVLEDHKLGVAFSAGPLLFREARTRFHELHPLLAAATTHRNNSDTDTAATTASLVAELVDCTRAVLLISADFYTAWNTRKELVQRGWLDARVETQFCNLVCSLHAKSIDTWAHRRWLATQLLLRGPCAGSSTAIVPLVGDAYEAFCTRQLDTCAHFAELKPRNYHAWSFRHWLVSHHLSLVALTRELATMERWCATHVTDHSGWNHRQHVVHVLVHHWSRSTSDELQQEEHATDDAAAAPAVETTSSSKNNSVQTLVVAEHAFVSTLLAAYPTHEALWCHRRFVVQLALRELCGRRRSCSSSKEELIASNTDAGEKIIDCTDATDSNNDTALRQLLSTLTETAAVETTDDDTASGNNIAWIDTRERRTLAFAAIATTLEAATTATELLTVVAREVDVAWRMRSRFAQRFALWCVERVCCTLQVSPTHAAQWRDLATVLRHALQRVDPLLDELWRAR